ncbi:MAG: DnaB-like helicase C-terminal domain-containing protein [Cyanobacteria bacterium P01_H01_bin.150]
MSGRLRFDKTKTKHISDVLINTFDVIDKQHQQTELQNLDTGFDDLDAVISGLKKGEVVVVAGRPTMGKTAFALNIANNVAQIYNRPAIIFSLVMDSEDMAIRLLSMEAEIERNHLQSRSLSRKESQNCSSAIARLRDRKLYVHSDPNLAFTDLETAFNQIALDAGEVPGLIVFDYLQLLVDENAINKLEELSRYTREFKKLAIKLKCPIILLSQLPREVEKRQNKRPKLSDLRQGNVEQNAHRVLMLYRDECYNLDTPDRGLAEIGIVKNQHGSKGIVKLFFEPQLTKFKNLTEPLEY